jgi:hypothetical protein
MANVRGSVFAYANVGLPLRNCSILSSTLLLDDDDDDDDDIDLTVDCAKPATIGGLDINFTALKPPERRDE